jgi:hypothetical protein
MMMRLRAFAALLCAAAALSGCEENAVQTIDVPAVGAQVRFFNFGLNAPGVNFYANNMKVTAISTAACTPPTDPACTTTGLEATTGVAYGSIVAGGLYSTIAPGQYTLTGRIAAATDKDLPISSVSATLANGMAYSYYQSGLYNTTTKQSDAFVVEDPIPAAVDFTVAQVRFVNAIHNSSPMTLYAKSTVDGQEYAIGGPVAYKSAGAFTPVPGANYDLSTRVAGSTTNVIVRTGVSFVAGRMYTISSRGDMTVTGTTATNRPFLDNTANR